MLGQATRLGKALLRTHLRRARRLVQSLPRLGRRKGEAAAQARRQAYARPIAVARKTQAQATRVGAAQAARRGLQGATVPAGEKIVNLFEPHSQSIVRHKAGSPSGRPLGVGRRASRSSSGAS